MYLLGQAGCLYTESMNHAPEGKIEIEESTKRLSKGGGVLLEAFSFDVDDHEINFKWEAEVVPDQGEENPGQRMFLTSPVGQLDAYAPLVLSTQSQLNLESLIRGTYTVTLRVTDIYGAEQLLTSSFVVENKEPLIERVVLERDPEVLTDRVPDIDGKYPVHAHYVARIDYTDATQVDPDGDLKCGRSGKVTWEIVQPGEDLIQYAEVIPCKGEEMVDSRMRFQLRKIKDSSSITLKVIAEDGLGGKATKEFVFPLAPNRPPCLENTSPEFQLPVIKIVHSVEKRFEASFINDDVKETYSFRWSVQDQGDGAFTELPGQNGEVLVLPLWFRPPGTTMQLRLIIMEQDGIFPGCDATDSYCQFAAGLPQGCYQWVTWNVEFL